MMIEARVGLLMSGSVHFPMVFGVTNSSILLEYLGDASCPARSILKGGVGFNSVVVAKQVIEAVNALHGKNILHNDLHHGNVLFNPRVRLVKVIDFGMACTIDHPQQQQRHQQAIHPSIKMRTIQKQRKQQQQQRQQQQQQQQQQRRRNCKGTKSILISHGR